MGCAGWQTLGHISKCFFCQQVPSWDSGIWLRRASGECYHRSRWYQLGRDGPADLAAYRRDWHVWCRMPWKK